MIITLQQIKENDPCSDGWKHLLKSLPGYTMGTRVSIEYILNTNRCGAAYWALKCLPYEDYCGLLADVADSVSHLTDDDRVHNCISIIRAYAKGEATDAQLEGAMDCAFISIRTGGDMDLAAKCVAWSAVNAASKNGRVVARNPFDAAAWAVWAAGESAAKAFVWGDLSEDARRKQWKTNEELMRSWISRQKHVDTRVGARK